MSDECRICMDVTIVDHPTNVIGTNPLTLRRALMHGDCYDEALADLKGSNELKYERFLQLEQ